MNRFTAGSSLLSLLSVAACIASEPSAARAGCTIDTECPLEQFCDAGSCRPEGSEPAVRCSRERDPDCLDGALCRLLDPDACEGDGCPLAIACGPAVGPTPSLRACANDGDCESGTCAAGVCLRLCDGTVPCPPGFDCLPMELPGGQSAQRCVGLDGDGVPQDGIAVCHGDDECGGETKCRFAAPSLCREDGLVATCTRPPVEATLAFGDPCGHFEGLPSCWNFWLRELDACPSRLCAQACEASEELGDAQVCREVRCTTPCTGNVDCALGTMCQQLPGKLHADGEAVRQCGIIKGGCWDQVDCCPEKDAAGECVSAWSAAEGACGLQAEGPYLLRYCVIPDGVRAATEAPCASDGECLTGICEPMLDGAGARCTTLCQTDRGTDRCAARQPGRTCVTPTIERLPGLQVCR